MHDKNLVGLAKNTLNTTSYRMSFVSCGTPNPADWMGVVYLLGVPLIMHEMTDHVSTAGYKDLHTLNMYVQ